MCKYACEESDRYLLTSDINATIKNAMPAKKRLPVRSHTIRATMPAGRMKRMISARTTIMIMPMTRRKISKIRSKRLPPANPGI